MLRCRGFSVLEILFAVVIVGLLAGISFPAYKSFKRHSERATCISQMDTVHSGLANFLVDRGNWPQMPKDALEMTEEEFFEWWIGMIEPYGVGGEIWLCPSDKIWGDKDYIGKSSTYVPTLFDAHSFTPHRWSQPWLMERGDLHGRGAHVAMPDGSVFPTQRPFAGY